MFGPSDAKKIGLDNHFDKLPRLIASHVLTHKGPDSHGRCLPKRAGAVDLDDLKEGLKIARAEGLSEKWQPWHFKGIRNQSQILDRLVIAKVENLIGEVNYEASSGQAVSDIVTRVCQRLNTRNLPKPIEVTVENKQFKIAFSTLFKNELGSSPFEVARRYLLAIGFADEARDLRSDHMKALPNGVLQNQETCNNALRKKTQRTVEHKIRK